MDSDKLPFYLRHLGQSIEGKIANAMKNRDNDDEDAAPGRGEMSTRNPYMDFMEPDWDDLNKKANLIVARYTVITTASNVLPFGLDMVAVMVWFTKMTTELAGVYQVIVTNKRARQISWAIATTTGTVLGATYAGSRIAKLIPGGYFFGVLVQAPISGAVAWAAGDTLKDYFKQTRMGREPGVESLRDSFAKALHINLKRTKVDKSAKNGAKTAGMIEVTGEPAGAAAVAPAPPTVSDTIEKIAALHELLRAGAITQDEFDAKKTDLLSKM